MTIDEFDTLYRELAPKAYRRACYMAGDAEIARDVVQSAFLSLWEQRVPIDNPAAYVNASIRNQIASRFRGLSHQERFERLYLIETGGEASDALWLVDEIHEFVETALSEAVRRVVRCVFYEHMSYQEAASELGISVSTVNKHIVTALRMLRQRFVATKKMRH